jgi:small-conductance mechanosensitive channel
LLAAGPAGDEFCAVRRAARKFPDPDQVDEGMKERLPVWLEDWMGVISPLAQVLLIVLIAWYLQRLSRRLLGRLSTTYSLPAEVALGTGRITSFLIGAAAVVAILERLGVSGMVLWTAFTGFTAVAAVAFFAAWSVLSNIFCAILIFATRPFRLNDRIEMLENGEKRGLGGQVVDINLIFTTLREENDNGEESLLRIPNSLFFQRSIRQWRTGGAAGAIR